MLYSQFSACLKPDVITEGLKDLALFSTGQQRSCTNKKVKVRYNKTKDLLNSLCFTAQQQSSCWQENISCLSSNSSQFAVIIPPVHTAL